MDATQQKAFMTFDRPGGDGARGPPSSSTRQRRSS